jgi:nickel-dependent lactate racemase
VTAAFAGDMERAHEKAIEFVRSISQCDPIVSDIVITSNGGYPLDQNLYQGPKAIATAELCCRDGGVIIMCCGCRDGFGGENFQKLMQMGTPEEVDKYLASIPPENTIPQQWCVQKFIHAQLNHKVILVTENLSREDVEKANMLLAHTPNEALEMAYEMLGHDAKVTVIPDGVAVLIN